MGLDAMQGTSSILSWPVLLLNNVGENCQTKTCLVIIVFRLHLLQENSMAGRRGSCFFLFLFGRGDFSVKIKKDELLALTSLQVSRTLLRGFVLFV